jgi:hypothetical protein
MGEKKKRKQDLHGAAAARLFGSGAWGCAGFLPGRLDRRGWDARRGRGSQHGLARSTAEARLPGRGIARARLPVQGAGRAGAGPGATSRGEAGAASCSACVREQRERRESAAAAAAPFVPRSCVRLERREQ